MSNLFTKPLIVSIQNRLRVIGLIGWTFVLLVILVAVIAPLTEHADYSKIVTYLSDVRMTPVWPQIGVFYFPAH